MDRLQDSAGQQQDLVNRSRLMSGSGLVPSRDPVAGIIVAEMPMAVAADRPARGLKGRQQVLDARDVGTLGRERHQRRIVRAERTGWVAQPADRLDDVVAERLADDPEERRGRLREQYGDLRPAPKSPR